MFLTGLVVMTGMLAASSQWHCLLLGHLAGQLWNGPSRAGSLARGARISSVLGLAAMRF